MDTTEDIVYRAFVLNDADIEESITGGGGSNTGITGSVVDSMDLSDVDVVQFIEKRSQADGSDAGRVDLGVRRIRMGGTLYGKSRGLFYDALFDLRAALNPVLAMREEPADKGYRALYFAVPTNRLADYPDLAIPLLVYALPRSFQCTINRDQIGGHDGDSLAIPWQATFVCRDPGIYAADPTDVAFSAITPVTSGVTSVAATDIITKAAHGLVAGDRITFYALTGGAGLALGTTYYVIATNLAANTFMVSATLAGSTVNHTTNITAASYAKSRTDTGTWKNRGNYLSIFNAVIEVGPGAGSIAIAVGDASFTITVPVSTGNRIIRIKGADKLVSFEEASVETVRFDLLTFDGTDNWPLIDPGTSAYTVTFDGLGGLITGSHMWFTEQYA